MASSTVKSILIISFFGIKSKKPEVGLGVVGKKTVYADVLVFNFPPLGISLVIKASAYILFLGYSIITGSLKDLELEETIVSVICFVLE